MSWCFVGIETDDTSIFVLSCVDVQADSGGLASTSRLPSGNDGARFFFSAKSSRESSQTKNVSSPTTGLRTPDLDDVSPRSR